MFKITKSIFLFLVCISLLIYVSNSTKISAQTELNDKSEHLKESSRLVEYKKTSDGLITIMNVFIGVTPLIKSVVTRRPIV